MGRKFCWESFHKLQKILNFRKRIHSTEIFSNSGRIVKWNETPSKKFSKFRYISQGCTFLQKFPEMMIHSSVELSKNSTGIFHRMESAHRYLIKPEYFYFPPHELSFSSFFDNTYWQTLVIRGILQFPRRKSLWPAQPGLEVERRDAHSCA